MRLTLEQKLPLVRALLLRHIESPSRTISPLLAKGMVGMIEYAVKSMKKQTADPGRYEGDNHSDSFSSGWDNADWSAAKEATATLQSLCDLFPDDGTKLLCRP